MCIAYTNLIRRYFKNTRPIVLSGVEASLRRIVHYDYKDNALRRSIPFDSNLLKKTEMLNKSIKE
jgi:radical SAM superfamily enzyme YgiQ (UPF0313 family)